MASSTPSNENLKFSLIALDPAETLVNNIGQRILRHHLKKTIFHIRVNVREGIIFVLFSNRRQIVFSSQDKPLGG